MLKKKERRVPTENIKVEVKTKVEKPNTSLLFLRHFMTLIKKAIETMT